MSTPTSQVLLYDTNIGTVIVASERPTIDGIFERHKFPKGSYAAELAERFYHYLIGRAIDVKKEYSAYYASEYDDVRRFLFHKHCLSDNWLKRLDGAIKGDDFVGLVQSTWGRDYQIEALLGGDDEYEVVAKTLGARWVENPNENKT